MYRNIEPIGDDIQMSCMAGIFPDDRSIKMKLSIPITILTPLTSSYNSSNLICSRCINVVTKSSCTVYINNSNIMTHNLKYINGTLTIHPVEQCKFLKSTNGLPKYVNEIDMRLPFYNIGC
jgi:hypothetical protein